MLLIGCGLSSEGVAEVDQEAPPGEAMLKLALKRLQSFSNEGTRIPWVSSGPGRPVVMPLGFPCRRYHFNAG